MPIKKFEPGDTVYTYHDAGSGGMQMSYFRVIRVTPKMIWIRWQHGDHAFIKSKEWFCANFYELEPHDWRPAIPCSMGRKA